jgi:hypothetical protein
VWDRVRVRRSRRWKSPACGSITGVTPAVVFVRAGPAEVPFSGIAAVGVGAAGRGGYGFGKDVWNHAPSNFDSLSFPQVWTRGHQALIQFRGFQTPLFSSLPT